MTPDHRTSTYDLWAVHSPYPDNTWRGVEKCSGQGFDTAWKHRDLGMPNSALLLFYSREDAEGFIRENDLSLYCIPVAVRLETPAIRQPIPAEHACERSPATTD